MHITGIEKLEFGVDNLTHCAKFMRDFGLRYIAQKKQFATLSGASIVLKPVDDPELPPAFEPGNTLRRMTWGVKTPADLDVLHPKFATQPGFRATDDTLECCDPNGMTLRVQISQQKSVELDVEPINQWGDIRRIDTSSPVYDHAEPINRRFSVSNDRCAVITGPCCRGNSDGRDWHVEFCRTSAENVVLTEFRHRNLLI